MRYEPPFNRTAYIDRLSMEVAEMVGSLVSSSDLSANLTLHRKLRVRTIRSSLMIEGNMLSEDAVTAILDGKHVLGNADDIREVQNASRAYALMDKLDPYSLDDLLRVHAVMMDGLVAEAGCFRAKNAGVFDGDKLIHAGTPASYVPEVVGELFTWLRTTDMHPLLASCIFHYEFEFIHPFADGNGRTGRLWHTLLLARWRAALAWLPVESAICARQQDYYAAIAKSNAEGSSEAFVAFMLEVIREALTPYASSASEADVRSKLALDYLTHNPKATIMDLAVAVGCSKRTAERLVATLKDEGSVRREGSARAGRWVVVQAPE